MQVFVNGEQRQMQQGSTVADLLNELQIPVVRVAIEINLEIIPKANYTQHTLADGDKIEIVHFVGGG